MRLQPRLHDGTLGTNHVQVDIQVMLDGEVHRIIAVFFRLTRHHRVLAVVHGVRAGTQISEASLEWRRVKIQFGVSHHLTSLDQILPNLRERDGSRAAWTAQL